MATEGEDNKLLQAVRESHCDRKDRKHACAGVITISPQGYKLDCNLCGGLDYKTEPWSNQESDGLEIVKAVLRTIGLDWSALSADIQLELIKTVSKMLIKRGE